MDCSWAAMRSATASGHRSLSIRGRAYRSALAQAYSSLDPIDVPVVEGQILLFQHL